MGVYRYKHEWCGFDQDIYLEGQERETIVVPCYRCGRDITARLIRDKSINVGKAPDGTVGITRNVKQNKDRRRGQK